MFRKRRKFTIGNANPFSQAKERHPLSVVADLYVKKRCCTACGVPDVTAPDLIGWTDEKVSHCYWRRQPETEAELEQAFKLLDHQELGCHRYAGTDPKIQARIGRESCDHPVIR